MWLECTDEGMTPSSGGPRARYPVECLRAVSNAAEDAHRGATQLEQRSGQVEGLAGERVGRAVRREMQDWLARTCFR